MRNIYAQGTSTDVERMVLRARRTSGQLEIGVTNQGQETNDISFWVEGADGLAVSPEVPDWENAVCVATSTTVSDGGCEVVQDDTYRHYRVHVASVATDAPSAYHVYAQDQAE